MKPTNIIMTIIRGNNPLKVYRIAKAVRSKGYNVTYSEIEALLLACRHGKVSMEPFEEALVRMNRVDNKKDFSLLVSCLFNGTINSYSNIEDMRKKLHRH